jgi:ABC-type transport system involved in multi-copper enzyme maturation permease subunit
MLKTLIRKEITETILDLRFWIVTALFLILIPLGMYVSRKDYESRLSNYQQEHQMYRQRYGNNIGASVEAQGFRPPPMLSIFALGLDPFMPDKAITSRSGLVRAAKEPGIDNPESLLFGKADFLFNVSFIVSLAALIFTFNRISGEREKGTLRLMVSSSVRRGEILLAKIIGNYVVLLVPFFIALLAALIILNTSSAISISSPELWPALLVILFITLLFILVMVSLGICVSSLTHGSIASIMMLFLVWVMAVLGVPKISPMIAEVIYPVESRNVVDLAQRIAREDIESEFNKKKSDLFKRCRTEFGVTHGNVSARPDGEAEKKANTKYDQEVVVLENECQRRITDAIRKLEQDYRNKQNIQTSLAMNLSRFSPVSCYTYLISGLAGTGPSEAHKFTENAERYQEQVKAAIYDNFVIKGYSLPGGDSASTTTTVEGFSGYKVSIPDMTYEYTTMAEVLRTGWIDILLLFVFTILFFSVAFWRFNKYDVR